MTPKHIGIIYAFLMPLIVFGQTVGTLRTDECKIIKAADLADPKAPRFADYPSKTESGGATAALDLTSNPIAKRYRTVLRQAMTEGANFAGHYRLATWGCGTSCVMFAVVNLKTGIVITATQIRSVVGTNLDADDFITDTKNDDWGFRFKSDSSLLIVLGAPNEEESKSGAYYFVLRDDRLHLIHSTRVKKNCESPHP